MTALTPDTLDRLRKKAAQSRCRYRVSAVAYNKRGDVIAPTSNKPRFNRKGGGFHAEAVLMRSIRGIHTIVICRVGEGGNLLPIRPCRACQKLADKLGIRLLSVGDRK
jgi:hypothetical protein